MPVQARTCSIVFKVESKGGGANSPKKSGQAKKKILRVSFIHITYYSFDEDVYVRTIANSVYIVEEYDSP